MLWNIGYHMKSFALALILSVLIAAPAAATPHYHPPTPPPAPPAHPPTQHRPPVINRPPVLPNQQILQQRQLQRGAAQELQAARGATSLQSIDDKIGDWGDFATLSDAELAALFKEMGVGNASFDRNQIKTMMLAEMAGSGAPPEVLQQMSAQLDGMLGMLQNSLGSSIASYPTDMAREFKQIYAANCCGKAQFIAALGAAETKLANNFRNEFAAGMAGMSARSGAPPQAVAAMQGAFGGTTTIIFDAGDPAVIAASNMVANGRGGATNIASNNTPGGNRAPPLNPGGNSNQAPPVTPGGNTPPVAPPVTPSPVVVTPTPGTPIQVTPAPGTQTPVTPTPGTPLPPLPTTSVPGTPVTGTPVTPPTPPVTPTPGTPPVVALTPGATPQPNTLSNLLPPVEPPERVSLLPGGADTSPPPPPPSPLDTSGLLDLTPAPATPSPGESGPLPDVLNTERVDATPVEGGPMVPPPGFGNDPVDDLRDKIIKIVGDIKRDPGRKPELIGTLRDLNTDLQNQVNQNNSSGLTGFWASDTSGTILTAIPYVIDGAKITVITVACVGTGGAACAGVAAVDTVFSFVDPAAGVVGNTIANYDNSNGGAGAFGTSTVSAIGSQLYEEGSKAIGGATFTQVVGKATVEGMGAKGEVLVKIAELGGKAIGEFGPGLFSGSGGSNTSYDASATLGSSGSGGSFYSGGSAGSGTLIQR